MRVTGGLTWRDAVARFVRKRPAASWHRLGDGYSVLLRGEWQAPDLQADRQTGRIGSSSTDCETLDPTQEYRQGFPVREME